VQVALAQPLKLGLYAQFTLKKCLNIDNPGSLADVEALLFGGGNVDYL
jgi:hypothetical protein